MNPSNQNNLALIFCVVNRFLRDGCAAHENLLSLVNFADARGILCYNMTRADSGESFVVFAYLQLTPRRTSAIIKP